MNTNNLFYKAAKYLPVIFAYQGTLCPLVMLASIDLVFSTTYIIHTKQSIITSTVTTSYNKYTSQMSTETLFKRKEQKMNIFNLNLIHVFLLIHVEHLILFALEGLHICMSFWK